jgi:gamma-D-glutamyl-L-lysine dipeptidyl-peptidase
MPITDKSLIVKVPVADLRSKPVDTKPVYSHDDLQETQVLYNEALLYLDEIEDWYYAEAIEQQKYTDKNIWQGYTGWIRKHSVVLIDEPLIYNAIVKNKTINIMKSRSEMSEALITVSIGTRLATDETADKKYYAVSFDDNIRGYINKDGVNSVDIHLSENQLRKAVVGSGMLFIGVPYLWGGRSMYMYEYRDGKGKGVDNAIAFNTQHSRHSTVLTGVDCSGLTNLAYRANNINIPRDAHEQWMAAQKIEYKQLKPGDLIFISAADKPDSVNHVMLNIGRNRFIEAAETGARVKIDTFKAKFGEGLIQLAEHNFIINNKQIHFGSFISKQ